MVPFEYYWLDPRVTLVPTEHLTPSGIATVFAAVLRDRVGWSESRIAFLGAAFALYWERATALARKTSLRPPRRRAIAVVAQGTELRPYAPLLNASAWTLYGSDLDPERSHVELVAYALLHGDRMAETVEVTRVAVDLAPYWLLRTRADANAFAKAALASTSPDGPTFRLVADSLPWLQQLRHETLKPPRVGRHRRIPGTGLLVPQRLEARPDALVEGAGAVAHQAVARFRARARAPAGPSLQRLSGWLASARPRLLVTARSAIVWDPDSPERLDPLVRALAESPAESVDDIAQDLDRIAAHTERFVTALADPSSLPGPDSAVEQRGYTFLHRDRGLLAYDLEEPGIERLQSPALPYAREMLGARAWHEWAHLAVDGGWVPRTVDEGRWRELESDFAAHIDRVVRGAPRGVRAATAPDLERLPGEGSAGARIARLFASRLSDYQANLLACRFMSLAERETYVRQNVRPLSREYAPEQLWRRLARLLYEAQYLRFSAIADPRSYLLDTTWLRDDFLATLILGEDDLDVLLSAAAALCECHDVDGDRFVPGALPLPSWRTD